MKKPKYPIGVQTFSKLIEEGYTYIDKTDFIGKLVEKGGYFFLSRPRRFGKSLLLSTIHAFFDGRRELFKGLAIDRMDLNWTSSPVIHLDLNPENYTREDALESLLSSYLFRYEKKYGCAGHNKSISQRFQDLIVSAYGQTKQKVVILVDEYDKPLLGLEEDSDLFEKNQALLKAFFGNLKTMDEYIRFALLTGVARFSKVSIFSDLNNLNDISLSEKFADICGWTEKELTDNFKPGIEELAGKRQESFDTTVNALRKFYDGYMFANGGSRLYNPFSVMLALYHSEIEPYWFETGTPTFLARRIREKGVDAALLNGVTRSREELVSVAIGTDDVIPLMFQTGYLTIASYDSRRLRYELRFPNREVEIGFAKNLLPLYAPKTQNPDGPFGIYSFQDDLDEGRPEDFIKRLATLIKDIPYEMHDESIYQSIAYLVCLLSGTEPRAEQHSYRGRSDLEVHTQDYIYIFEFKFNGSAEEAIAQIRNRDYAGRYAFDPRRIYIIGANFSNRKPERGLDAYIIEKIK